MVLGRSTKIMISTFYYITTMRSDLNIVSNTVDVVSYDLRDVKNNVETLNSEMAETKTITKYLKEDLDKTKIISYTALAFGIAGTVGSVASIGMQLASNGITFAAKDAAGAVNPGTGATKGAGGMFRGLWTRLKAWFQGNKYTQVPTLHAEVLALSPRTSINAVIAWCEEDDALESITYDCEEENPEEASLSVQSTYEVCHQFRSSLKPAFLKLAKRINEINDEIDNIDVSEQITACETKINDKLKEYISRYELIREDIIDMFAKYDNEHKVLMIEFEDNITYVYFSLYFFTT